MVEVSFDPTAGDYLALQRLMLVNGLKRRRFWTRILLALVVAFGIIALFAAIAGDTVQGAFVAALGGCAVGFVALAIFLGTHWLLMPRRARRWFGQHRALHRTQHQRWTAEGLFLHNDRGESFHPWEELYGWAIGANIVLAFATEQMAYFVPRRALSDEQVATLDKLLRQSGLPRR